MMASLQPFGEAHAVKCEVAADALRLCGTLRLEVRGWSMLPAVWPGDTLVIERVEGYRISKGDLVLFNRDRRLFVHRVVTTGVDGSSVLTQGDAMLAPDPVVQESELLGRVSMILRKGKSIAPRRNQSFSARAVAALVRRSELAARVVVGVHGGRQIS